MMMFQPTGGAGGGVNAWITGTAYVVGDIVYYGKNLYVCITAHTAAAAFETDFAATKWRLVSQMNPNYIADFDGSNIGKWATYADAAGTSPVDGTGGVANVTFAASTDSSMRGTTNFLFTHDAVNRQGQGFSYDFSIDPSDKGKVLQCSFEYLIASGTYASGDLTFWIYDVTNGVLIQPAPYSLQNSGIIDKFPFEFQTSSNSTSYRLIGHVTTTTATAYTIRFCNFNLGPQAKLYGSPVTDPVAWTPTGSWTTNTTYSGYWQRFGNNLIASIKIALSGAPNAVNLSVNIPSGMSIDTTKQMSSTPGEYKVGDVKMLRSSVTRFVGFVSYATATSLDVQWISVDATAANTAQPVKGNDIVNATQPATWANGDIIAITFMVPITGWSSNTVMSSDAAVNVVAAKFNTNTARTINNTNPAIVYETVEFDTTGSYNASTGVYTVPVSGKYRISGFFRTAAFAAGGIGYVTVLGVKKGSTTYAIAGVRSATTTSMQLESGGSTTLDCVAGDILTFTVYSDTTSTLAASSSTANWIALERISGPAQIAASETVAAVYNDSSSRTSTTSGNYATLVFPNKEIDTHSAFANGVFTAPISGTYSATINIFVNGVVNASISDVAISPSSGTEGVSRVNIVSSSAIYSNTITKSFKLLAGQTLTFKWRNYYTGSAPTTFNDGSFNSISVVKVGNY